MAASSEDCTCKLNDDGTIAHLDFDCEVHCPDQERVMRGTFDDVRPYLPHAAGSTGEAYYKITGVQYIKLPPCE
jgi:hypothetical protein